MKTPFASPPIYRYAIPVNDGRDSEGVLNESVTVELVTVQGWHWQRLSLLTRFLKHKFGLKRADAHEVLRAMGFNDLYEKD